MIMAKNNDFMEGFLRGLYQSGVGNSDVQRANQRETLDRNAALTAKMAENGMVPTQAQPDIRQKIGGFISSMFGGSSAAPMLASNFQVDPTQSQYGMSQQGEYKQFPPGQPLDEGFTRLKPAEGKHGLGAQFAATRPEPVITINPKTGDTKTIGEAQKGSHFVTVPTAGDDKQTQQQDKLEKEYRDMLNKTVSLRSGGLGLQDSKVNQAIDLQNMLNQFYDEKTGIYNIPPSMHTELSIGLARLLSPTGQVAENLVNKLQQSTGREALANNLIYLGFSPEDVGGTTQSVAKLFAHSIRRQGETAEKLRDTYISQLRKRAPSGLSMDRRKYLESTELGNKFTDYLPKSDNGSINSGSKPKTVIQNGHTYTLNQITGKYE